MKRSRWRSRPCRDSTTTGPRSRLIAQLHLATAPWLRGAVAEAESALEANIDRWRALGEPDRAAFGLPLPGADAACPR